MKVKRFSVSCVWVLATLLIAVLVNFGCSSDSSEPLRFWNETEMKRKIIDYVTSVSDSSDENYIPESDRIAVFDMDGTIICEQPLWLEMNVAVNQMYQAAVKNPFLLENPLYKIAYDYHNDPTHSEKRQALEDKAIEIMTHAFAGVVQDEYIAEVSDFINNTNNDDYGIPLKMTFYQPMLELITYLQENNFQVYIVSGSEQGLIWGVCEGNVPLTREHQIGTRIELDFGFNSIQSQSKFLRGDEYLKPRNLRDGKAENIYYQLGKTPVFAFGNTADDFDMFNLALSSVYRSIAFLLDHDDAKREYNYPDDITRANWKKDANSNGWHVVSMKENFKQIFLTD